MSRLLSCSRPHIHVRVEAVAHVNAGSCKCTAPLQYSVADLSVVSEWTWRSGSNIAYKVERIHVKPLPSIVLSE
jgi:hypothetical protein